MMFCDSCEISRMCDNEPVTGAMCANNLVIYVCVLKICDKCICVLVIL